MIALELLQHLELLLAHLIASGAHHAVGVRPVRILPYHVTLKR